MLVGIHIHLNQPHSLAMWDVNKGSHLSVLLSCNTPSFNNHGEAINPNTHKLDAILKQITIKIGSGNKKGRRMCSVHIPHSEIPGFHIKSQCFNCILQFLKTIVKQQNMPLKIWLSCCILTVKDQLPTSSSISYQKNQFNQLVKNQSQVGK